MNELMLFIIVVVVLIAENFLVKKIKQPTKLYISLAVSLGLILLIWFASSNKDTTFRFLLSSFALANALTSFMRYNSSKKLGNTTNVINKKKKR